MHRSAFELARPDGLVVRGDALIPNAAPTSAAIDARVGALVTWSSMATIVRWPPESRSAWHERGFTEVINARTGQVLRLGTAPLAETTAFFAANLLEGT